jgi:hypothetical protein
MPSQMTNLCSRPKPLTKRCLQTIFNVKSSTFFFFYVVFILFSVNGRVTELKKNTLDGQGVNIETTGRQCVNGSNHTWIKCTFPK